MASRLKKLLTDGQVIEGTLSRVTVGSTVHYQLTSKERGKTKTVYVPLCAKQEVEQWALLNPLLVGLLPAEDEERFVYSTPTLFWTVAIGFIEHLIL